MNPILTSSEMRALERWAIDGGRVKSLDLQERAAEGAAALVPAGVPVEVLAGPGNNGGDALAVARLLKRRGESVRVWTLAPDAAWKGDAGLQAARWKDEGGSLYFAADPVVEARLEPGAWVVDGLFGLSASRPLEGTAARWAEKTGDPSAGFTVLALDQPSGIQPDEPDSGTAFDRADLTACFGHLKPCHVLRPAAERCGKVVTVPLPLPGLTEGGCPVKPRLWLMDQPKLSAHPWNVHKGGKGRVTIRAGSLGMSGAAVLAALGALRAGAGLVTVLADAAVRAEIAVQVPEAMVHPWTGVVPPETDVLLAGPGGVKEAPEWRGRLVLDASALKEGQGKHWMTRPQTILTPHAGEFARLFQLPAPSGSGERLRQARAAAASGPGVLLLKGAQSLIAGGETGAVVVNGTGHGGLATGGTGDFLAGMVAGWWAQSLEPDWIAPRNAAAAAAWLHGRCADRLGPGPLLPRDLAEELPRLLRDLHAGRPA
ncbi:MAG: NAD(P)H-hydrate dehydratase [Holophagaceae bacterium]